MHKFMNWINDKITAFEEYIARDPLFAKHVVDYWNDLIVNMQIDENILNELTEIFILLNNRDEFLNLYRIALSQRLLSNTNNLEIEKQSLAKLRLRSGTQYTFELDNMLLDATESQEFTREFNNNITVMMMSSVNWPPIIGIVSLVS
ncbi:cullin protein, putative [Theileria equi strain WA]|uniref:Cullin protein, putative n=1 Tax=Theileria equi strain WA TaxID=1537102 RepID=L0B0C9_THEEQ|nr:cullin protein, putative [Theileria equi strain WA]AFZ81312.1 cullin protein, putative [Theileria equi strain WA]|eukprot:XP_004830978.1 cullin protein, putative [Theileria equi strain WA]